jgi:hypothetical protein
MGFDKTLIKVRGGLLFQHLIETAKPVAGELLASVNDSAPCKSFDLPVVNRVSDFLSSPALRVHLFDSAEFGFPDSDLLNLNDRSDLSRFEPGTEDDGPD